MTFLGQFHVIKNSNSPHSSHQLSQAATKETTHFFEIPTIKMVTMNDSKPIILGRLGFFKQIHEYWSPI